MKYAAVFPKLSPIAVTVYVILSTKDLISGATTDSKIGSKPGTHRHHHIYRQSDLRERREFA